MKKRVLSFLLAAAVAGSIFAACGSSGSKSASYDTATSESAASAYGDYYVDEESNGTSYEAEDGVEAKNSDNAGLSNLRSEEAKDASDGGESGQISSATDTFTSQKLVYRGSVTLQSMEYDKCVKAINDAVKNAGGFVEYQNESNNNYRWYYAEEQSMDDRMLNITVRIPSARYEDFIQGLSEYGKVMDQSKNVENITREYHSNEAQIAALKKEQERLLQMMDKAETMEDMIKVESRLSEVESNLNQYETQKSSMDLDVMYSSVTISVEEVSKLSPSEKEEGTFLYRLKKAFKGGWSGLITFFQNILIGFLYILPLGSVFALILVLVIRMVKKHNKKRLQKLQARAKSCVATPHPGMAQAPVQNPNPGMAQAPVQNPDPGMAQAPVQNPNPGMAQNLTNSVPAAPVGEEKKTASEDSTEKTSEKH